MTRWTAFGLFTLAVGVCFGALGGFLGATVLETSFWKGALVGGGLGLFYAAYVTFYFRAGG